MRNLMWLSFLVIFLNISCKKNFENQPLNTGEQGNPPFLAAREGGVLGLQELLELEGLNSDVKKNIDTSDYFYYPIDNSNKIWIVALRDWTYEMPHSKAVVVLENGTVNLNFVSFNYDERSFVHGQFDTYNGRTIVYSDNFDLVLETNYSNGRITSIFPEMQGEDVKMDDTQPPYEFINWCVLISPLCSYTGGSNPSNASLATLLMMNPPNLESGGGGAIMTVTQYLTGKIGLNNNQSQFLLSNPDRADEIYRYILARSSVVSEEEKKEIVKQHIDKMIADPNYKSFVENHGNSTTSGLVWWEDDVWLSNPNNFNLHIDAIGNQYEKLSAAEKVLLKKYPIPAFMIFINKSTAESYTISKMGVNGLNDKSDAFRHAFFQALNTVSIGIGPSITQQFADAHESEVPYQLRLEKEMDLFNNLVGITLGQNTSFWTSLNDLANTVKNKIDNGEMKYLKPTKPAPNPPGQPVNPNADPNFWGTNGVPDKNTATHGIDSTTQIILTNQ